MSLTLSSVLVLPSPRRTSTPTIPFLKVVFALNRCCVSLSSISSNLGPPPVHPAVATARHTVDRSTTNFTMLFLPGPEKPIPGRCCQCRTPRRPVFP